MSTNEKCSDNMISDYYPIAKSKRKKQSTVQVQKPLHSKKAPEQEIISEEERLLIEFDMNYEYGPSLNLTRLERWDRAYKLNLNPPLEIRDLILSKSEHINPVWNDHPILD